MASLYNLARMTTLTTGTGTISLQAAATGYLSFADAGVQTGETVSYGIIDGNSSEVGRGVYTSAGTTLTRSVLKSTNSNNAINLTGAAEVFICGLAEDFSRMLISETTTSSSASEVSFSSIPQGFRDLEVIVRGRADAVADDVAVRIQFNGDTAANYRFQQIFGAASNAAVQDNSEAQIVWVQLPGANSTTGFVGAGRMTIFNYRDTTFHKGVISHGTQNVATNNQRTLVTSGSWASTSAITSIRVFLASGNFVDGSIVSLYGLL